MKFGREQALRYKHRPIMYFAYKLLGDVNLGGRIRANHLLRGLQNVDLRHKRVLDAGSGDGGYSFYLARCEPTLQVTGVELDDTKIATCEEIRQQLQLSNLQFVKGSLTEMEYQEQFDYVVCSDVLEHIPADELAIKHLYRALKRGGTLVLHVPGLSKKPFIWERSRILNRKHEKWYAQHTAHRPEFYHDARPGYTHDGIAKKLEHAGFHIEKVRYTYGTFGLFAFKVFKVTRMFLPLYILLLPSLLFLGYLDVVRENKQGFSTLVVAKKRK